MRSTDMPDCTEAMASEDVLPMPCGFPSPDIDALTTQERIRSYERFYNALVSHWVAVETLWITRTQTWSNAKEFDEAFELVYDMWTNNSQRSLQEKIDIVEIVDFVWGFLGRKPFPVSSVPCWLEGERDHILQRYIDENATDSSNWGGFMRSVYQYLPLIIFN
ncbi:hypothetical protein N7486_008697 [Penicillium sp. IBT 16267x]|nr:hypothetical protein N7486_008697 [Penicillium sp. IBT 16267x]